MLNSHELIDLTLATMADEDTWLSVQQAINNAPDAEVRDALEELCVIAAGLAVVASAATEVDAHYLVDTHYDALHAEIENQR